MRRIRRGRRASSAERGVTDPPRGRRGRAMPTGLVHAHATNRFWAGSGPSPRPTLRLAFLPARAGLDRHAKVLELVHAMGPTQRRAARFAGRGLGLPLARVRSASQRGADGAGRPRGWKAGPTDCRPDRAGYGRSRPSLCHPCFVSGGGSASRLEWFAAMSSGSEDQNGSIGTPAAGLRARAQTPMHAHTGGRRPLPWGPCRQVTAVRTRAESESFGLPALRVKLRGSITWTVSAWYYGKRRQPASLDSKRESKACKV